MKGALARVGAALRAGRDDARPHLAAEAHLFRALGRGSLALLYRPYRWCLDAGGMDTVWHALGLFWALAAAGWGVSEHPIVVPPLVLVWCVVALRLGHEPPPGKIDKDAGEQPNGPVPEVAEVAPRPPSDDELVLGLAHLIGTRNGVLLRTAVEHFREAGAPDDWGIPQVRAQCAALSIRIRATVKTPQGVSPGVHRDDLQAALSTLASSSPDPSPALTPIAPQGAGS